MFTKSPKKFNVGFHIVHGTMGVRLGDAEFSSENFQAVAGFFMEESLSELAGIELHIFQIKGFLIEKVAIKKNKVAHNW